MASTEESSARAARLFSMEHRRRRRAVLGRMGAMGGIVSKVGGGSRPGGLAGLAGGFKQLGLDSDWTVK